MSTNYIDPKESRPVEIGPCRCGAKPSGHETDTAVIRTRFAYGDLGIIRQAGRQGGPEAANIAVIVRGVESWNLVLPDGKPRPVDILQANLLDEITVIKLVALLDDAFPGEDEESPPNTSGDPSTGGSPTDGTRTPTIPAQPQPTTS